MDFRTPEFGIYGVLMFWMSVFWISGFGISFCFIGLLDFSMFGRSPQGTRGRNACTLTTKVRTLLSIEVWVYQSKLVDEDQ